mmetsp:Transcript_31869/g.100038  ORF Transcript_31869/g.100038 Transcript_31869/m.100038 type:complete len:138 (+) Transcript_31869:180-593(+)
MPWASFPRRAWPSSPPPHAPLIVGADTLTPLTRSEPGTCRLDVESRGLPGPCPATSCLPVPRVYLTVPYRAPPRISPYLAIPPHICRYDPHPPAALERPAYIPPHRAGHAELVEIAYPEHGVARVWRLPRELQEEDG